MKLTMVSLRHKGVTYTGFVYMKPGDTLSDEYIFKIVGHNVPVGSTFTPGG